MNAHPAEMLICPSTLPAEMEQLETPVQSRLNGRVRHYRLVVRECGLILMNAGE
jgi:hypothetical protein